MKKAIFSFIFAMILLCSCVGPKVVYDTQRTATVERITVNYANNKSNYIVKAWSYQPNLKEYKIYTYSIYQLGQQIIIKGKK